MQPPTIFGLVARDLRDRDKLGERSYGGPMLAHDGRDTLRDAYEEALDLALYLRKLLAERSAS